MAPVLETARLSLSPLTLDDVGALHALYVDPDVRRFMCDGRVYPEAQIRKAILRSIGSFRSTGAGFYAIRVREDGAFAGYAGLKVLPYGDLELGAGLWPRHWRHGIAREACEAILADAFGRLGARRVVACADAPNFRSLALIARLGFRPYRNTPGVFGAVRWFVRERDGG